LPSDERKPAPGDFRIESSVVEMPLALPPPPFVRVPAEVRPAPSSGTAPFVLDGNRVYAEVSFVRPDGEPHRALVFVDMGSPSLVLKDAVYRELEVDRGRDVTFRVGSLPVTVPAATVESDPGKARALGTELRVEGVLPAGVLQKYDVAIDYRGKT